MQASKAPTPGTSRPSAFSAVVEVGRDGDVRADPLQGPLPDLMLPEP